MNIESDEWKEAGLTVAALGASFLLKRVLEEAYEFVYKEDPPNAVKDDEINWGKVVGWTIISGIAATATRVLVKRYGGQRFLG